MDLSRVRTADWITGAAGVALLLVMFARWYEVSDGSATAWQAFSVLDLWFALLGLLGIAVPVVTAVRDSPAVPIAMDVIASAAGIIAVPLILWRLLAAPDIGGADPDLAWGAFAGAACVLGVLGGAWAAMRDERAPGQRRPPAVEVMDAPPAGAGPEPSAPAT